MTLATSTGPTVAWPEIEPLQPMSFTDRDAASRLRDRVAREVAACIDSGQDRDDIEHLLAAYRWLDCIASEGSK